MAVYVYVCSECGDAHEVEHPMILEPVVGCEVCGNAKRRKPATLGFIVR
jgi:putative FmdB family regulatory protein